MSVPQDRNSWTSVPLTQIGSTDLRQPNTFTFDIPSVIPSTANNVLVYAAFSCGYANRGVSQHIKIYTKDGSEQHYSKYLFMLTYDQYAHNTNSENMWFPMPADHKVYMTVYKDAGDNCGAYIHVIGYN